MENQDLKHSFGYQQVGQQQIPAHGNHYAAYPFNNKPLVFGCQSYIIFNNDFRLNLPVFDFSCQVR